MRNAERFAAIFDMDGVLVDSPGVCWDSFNEYLTPLGVHLTDEEAKKSLGRSMKDLIAEWNKTYGLNLDFQNFGDTTFETQKRTFAKMDVDRSLIAFLDDLNVNHVPYGIGTSSRRVRAEEILDILKLRSYFPILVTANDVEAHKPAPDLFLETARRLQMPPERCVVFEDAENGIDAARAGNMKTIGYLTKHNNAYLLRNADKLIKSFSEVSYKTLAEMMG